MSVVMSPLLDFDYPPIRENTPLEMRLRYAHRIINDHTGMILGRRIPLKDGGLSLFDALFWEQESLPAVVFQPGVLPLGIKPKAFLGGWLLYSIGHAPGHALLFFARQYINGLLMFSGAYLDDAPNLQGVSYGTLVPYKLSILNHPPEETLGSLSSEDKKPSSFFVRYFSILFDALRYKKLGFLIFRLLFIVCTAWYIWHFGLGLIHKRIFNFGEWELFSFFAVGLFFFYTGAMALLSPITPRYYVLIYGIILLFFALQLRDMWKRS